MRDGDQLDAPIDHALEGHEIELARFIARDHVDDGAFAPQIVPHSVFGYAAALPPPRYDAAAARALLEKTHRLPVKLTLTHRDAADAVLGTATAAGARAAALSALGN